MSRASLHARSHVARPARIPDAISRVPRLLDCFPRTMAIRGCTGRAGSVRQRTRQDGAPRQSRASVDGVAFLVRARQAPGWWGRAAVVDGVRADAPGANRRKVRAAAGRCRGARKRAKGIIPPRYVVCRLTLLVRAPGKMAAPLTSNPWTDNEVRRLRRWAGVETSTQIAKRLKRSPESIIQKAKREGLALALPSRREPWTKSEVDLLRKHAGKITVPELALLVGRGQDALRRRARKEGFSVATGVVTPTSWTEEELQTLRDDIAKKSIKQIAEELGRHPENVRRKAISQRLLRSTPRSHYTEKEISVIHAHVGQLTVRQLASLLGRPYQSVKTKVRDLGVWKGSPISHGD